MFNITFDELQKTVCENNILYIKEKLNIKKKLPKHIYFFQIISCLDLVEITLILRDNGFPLTAIKCFESVLESDGMIVESNFDCYLPYDQKRDYLIKDLMKKEDSLREK